MTHRRFTPAFRAAVVAAVLLTAAPSARGPEHLETAESAAAWIRASAVETPHGLVWPADPADRASAVPNLYSGTPGVVLFLLELHHATGNARHLADAARGADHLMATLDARQGSGLYTGLAGIGYALGETHRATGDVKYRDGMKKVVTMIADGAQPVDDGVEWSPVTDIISGTAGTGLFLLHAAKVLGDDDARALAAKAGRRLLAMGEPEHGGLKWKMSADFPRMMPNFSHGTAGIAYFLATLYDETKEKAFLDGALAGAAYLKEVAVTEGDVCLIFHHEPEEAGRKLFYLGYCHGPAGTARLWYRLYRTTGDAAWLEWAEKSARGVIKSGIPEHRTPGFWNNVSQCCGSAGVASFMLALHEVTGKAEYLAFSRKVTADLLSRATVDAAGARWVQAEHRVRPEQLVAQTGWMQGAAGIGAWLVQLDGFEKKRARFVRLPDDPY
jgi:lantibiotic modifying enzyme